VTARAEFKQVLASIVQSDVNSKPRPHRFTLALPERTDALQRCAICSGTDSLGSAWARPSGSAGGRSAGGWKSLL